MAATVVMILLTEAMPKRVSGVGVRPRSRSIRPKASDQRMRCGSTKATVTAEGPSAAARAFWMALRPVRIVVA